MYQFIDVKALFWRSHVIGIDSKPVCRSTQLLYLWERYDTGSTSLRNHILLPFCASILICTGKVLSLKRVVPEPQDRLNFLKMSPQFLSLPDGGGDSSDSVSLSPTYRFSRKDFLHHWFYMLVCGIDKTPTIAWRSQVSLSKVLIAHDAA